MVSYIDCKNHLLFYLIFTCFKGYVRNGRFYHAHAQNHCFLFLRLVFFQLRRCSYYLLLLLKTRDHSKHFGLDFTSKLNAQRILLQSVLLALCMFLCMPFIVIESPSSHNFIKSLFITVFY